MLLLVCLASCYAVNTTEEVPSRRLYRRQFFIMAFQAAHAQAAKTIESIIAQLQALLKVSLRSV